MTKFKKISELIKTYQKDADKLFSDYQRQEKRARERFSESAFKTEFMMQEWPKFSGKAKGNAENTIRNVNDLFNELEEDLKNWIMKPLNVETLQTLNLINAFGIKLSLGELKVIEKSVNDSYFGTKVFSGLAKKAGYFVNISSMDDYLKELQATRRNAETAVRAYAGQTPFPGRDLIGEWTYNGMNLGEFQPHHLFYAANFLHADGPLDRLEAIWESIHAPMQYLLTPDEAESVKKKVDSVFDSFGDLVPKEADKLIKNEPGIVDKLQSMPDYEKGKEIEKYVLSQNLIEEKTPENESKIDAASSVAKEYSTRLGKVDESLLAQFK